MNCLETFQLKKRIGLIVSGLFLALCWSPPVQHLIGTPDQLMMKQGTHRNLNLDMPVSATVTSTDDKVVAVNGQHAREVLADLRQPLHLQSESTGNTSVVLKLFGVIPLKTVQVHVVPDLKVIPGGQSIGVKIHSKGIMVVGYNLVRDGVKTISPAEQANIRIGDVITEIDGKTVKNVDQVAKWIQQAGENHQEMVLTIQRHEELVKTKLLPILDKESNRYRIGLYIRDSAAGVGTLTFYDPKHHVFGALGHVITDADTGQPIQGTGKVIHASVTSINKGESGQPGEKRGVFIDEDHVLGEIKKNSDFGVFGSMQDNPDHAYASKEVPIALPDEVHVGPAKILTVIKGQKVEQFDIQIVNVFKQESPATKSMVLKVTDPRLLNKTGGIVQGMSGSPILQDGKLVGAVTHVFVNDPTQGYGVYIEWMLNEAGVQTRESQTGATASVPNTLVHADAS
ncbi:SpoIVB peptidase [Fodinisporobacter ferrooxydans]|uniref:SpoIVB peptidase n=1 Tax=Fodinisporobacter ferrooxydans TaxID=2901836 RepID=A0ABY4CJA3_9BACL|nr:SpoIVB peptidase [Alicyclobacillaceae bacterium MYW30-H2]